MRVGWNGHDTIVWILIESGARPSLTDEKGKSAMDYAFEGRHLNIACTLR